MLISFRLLFSFPILKLRFYTFLTAINYLVSKIMRFLTISSFRSTQIQAESSDACLASFGSSRNVF